MNMFSKYSFCFILFVCMRVLKINYIYYYINMYAYVYIYTHIHIFSLLCVSLLPFMPTKMLFYPHNYYALSKKLNKSINKIYNLFKENNILKFRIRL